MACKRFILVVLLSVLSVGASAHKAGDFVLRMGPAAVFPTSDSNDLDTVNDGRLAADNGISLGITTAYMFADNWGVGLLGAYPFRHEIRGKGALAGGDLASAKHLPPTLVLQYHFLPESTVQPYIGAGINYTMFFDEDSTARLDNLLGKSDVELDDSWGYAFEAGVDVKINENWLVNASVWYLDIESEATITTAGVKRSADVEINPIVAMLAVGYKF